jgi:hypothetical protein
LIGEYTPIKCVVAIFAAAYATARFPDS